LTGEFRYTPGFQGLSCFRFNAEIKSERRGLMKAKKQILTLLDNFENYFSQILLTFFICLLFLQIALRVISGLTLSWSEELSRFAFVWFVFLGASHAARLYAHNRVVVQFRWAPKRVVYYIEAFGDLIWIGFNLIMVWKSIGLIRSMMEFTYHSPTLNLSMAYVYMIFPISFTLMTIRIIQVNYLKLVKNVDFRDPDQMSEEPEPEAGG
jgi:TRAP-type C4-dicarboxylate transport system permease small subunit